MPDVLSVGLGGGSLVCFETPAAHAAGEAQPGGCTVGPDSVGAALEQQALCCGGACATASDAAVVLGHMKLGSREAAAARLSQGEAQAAWAEMQRMLEGCLDRAKTEAGEQVQLCRRPALGTWASPARVWAAACAVRSGCLPL